MNNIVVIIFICNYLITMVKSVSIQIIPQRNNREIMVEGKSENGLSNRISKTFENILRNMNVSEEDVEKGFRRKWPEKNVINILANGTLEDIKEITREDLINSLWLINKLDLSQEKQFLIWVILNGEDQITDLKINDLEQLSNLLPSISEMHLININVTDDRILNFLGTYKKFTNRQVGILAYALKLENASGNNPQNVDFVNKIKGLLCGFGETHLETINSEDFKLINQSVFGNLWSCNLKQLKALLKIAQRPKAYGPIMTWSKEIVSKLGFVITAMEVTELREIFPESLENLTPEVVERLNADQLKALTKGQVKYLQNSAYTKYMAIIQPQINDQAGGKDRNIGKITGVVISVVIFLVI